VHPTACSTVFRRFVGPVADELATLCRPEDGSPDTVAQAEAVYRAFAALLAAQRASFHDLTCETLFLRDIRRDLPLVLAARKQVLADLGQDAGAPLGRFIQQAPVDPCASFELAATAVTPRDRSASSVQDVRAAPTCACEGCTRTGARLVRLSEQVSLHTTNVYGVGNDTFEQAADMFRNAERLLNQCGMGFRDVVRTWIHLRDIGRDYDVLNKARRQFFRDRGIEQRPASTGVQGVPFPDAHHCSVSLDAVRSQQSIDVTPMSTPTLNEAWSYGVDFSRGLNVSEVNKVTLYVSGTASIDEAGRTVHVGKFASQVERMLDNIESLHVQQGATFENLVSGAMYLRDAGNAAVLASICRERGFAGFPCAVVEASLCRPELLCEAEAVAMLPLHKGGV
jgi:enamine deaminase RidA (YjgF/YER057c/UK114 family)